MKANPGAGNKRSRPEDSPSTWSESLRRLMPRFGLFAKPPVGEAQREGKSSAQPDGKVDDTQSAAGQNGTSRGALENPYRNHYDHSREIEASSSHSRQPEGGEANEPRRAARRADGLVLPISVGIDFGTMRTGFAYGVSQHTVSLQRDWPGIVQSSWTSSRGTLTALLYKRVSGSYLVAAWGWEALEQHRQAQGTPQASDFCYVDRLKLLLVEPGQYAGLPDPRLPAGRTARDIVADFLCCLKDKALSSVRLHYKQADLTPAKWVLAVPAAWTLTARQNLRVAAVQAGLASSEHDEQCALASMPPAAVKPGPPVPETAPLLCRLLLVSEPEAAIISGFKGQAPEGIAEGSMLVVVDAGGYTVDITAHTVVRRGSSWGLQEASAHESLLLGAACADARFEEHLRRLLGGNAYDLWAAGQPLDHLRLIYDKWEEAKTRFRGTSDTFIDLTWSKSLMQAFRTADMEDVELCLTWNTMQALFSTVVSDIVEAVCAFKNGLPGSCGHVLLVGGLGKSQWLQKELQTALLNNGCACSSTYTPSLEVLFGTSICGHTKA